MPPFLEKKMNLDQLKRELQKQSVSDIVNNYILAGDPVCLGGNLDLLMKLKKSIANHFDIHVKSIEIVGSSKLGISLNDEKLGKLYDTKSDIDVVIVSSELFDIGWHELLKLDFKYHKLKTNDRESLKDCYETMHRGYVSPDRLPVGMDFSKRWWKIFSELSSCEEYEYRKVRGRLFKNWWFVEKYYSIQLTKLSKLLGGEK